MSKCIRQQFDVTPLLNSGVRMSVTLVQMKKKKIIDNIFERKNAA